MSEFREKLQTLHFGSPRKPREAVNSDGDKVVEALHDKDGQVAGAQIHHADGRKSAHVVARPANAVALTN